MTILHIPHASSHIPSDLRQQFVVDGVVLEAELRTMTDWFTDELFGGTVPGATEVVYPVSRLVVDPERFANDADEPAARVGMGAVYLRTSAGTPLRAPLPVEEREALLARFYRPHHESLSEAVGAALDAEGHALVIDCHSFPLRSVPFELSDRRPDICIGSDPFHTPGPLLETAVRAFEDQGFSVGVDDPFAGALVPERYYRRDARVQALMVEVGRWLYMDEDAVVKHDGFAAVRRRVAASLRHVTARAGGVK